MARIVATAFVENVNNKPQVNHIDGNKKNNRWDNLEWVTPLENITHASLKGLRKGCARKGDKNPKASLTWEQVHEIRKLDIPVKELVKRFSVSETTIYRVLKKKSWLENE